MTTDLLIERIRPEESTVEALLERRAEIQLDPDYQREGDIWATDLTMKPSEYFKKQCFVSVEPDEDGVKYVIDYLGTDRLVFSTDYPHGDSKFPHAVENFLQLKITEDDKRKILWDNCAEFYHVN